MTSTPHRIPVRRIGMVAALIAAAIVLWLVWRPHPDDRPQNEADAAIAMPS